MFEDDDYEDEGCEGHPAGPYDQMGVTVYCDGSCRCNCDSDSAWRLGIPCPVH